MRFSADWTDTGISPKVGVVPNPSKSTPPSSSPKTAMPFEEALQKLESVVEAMESGDLALESLLAKFEEGTRLVKTCQAKLEEAEVKIFNWSIVMRSVKVYKVCEVRKPSGRWVIRE